mmetsp:Transcript_9243/g.23717  ORF Transcript_9243/g.23717 Transcript_9243/m.23717 type:complete len:361 (-) Transcript_9243:2550-3632(-)
MPGRRDAAAMADEGVWTPEIESAFKEALFKWPQCGRRKIVFEGKMYGRNEIIALWILRKTGQKRTRKQVSSHIQVLGRKRKRETNGAFEGQSSSEIVTRNLVGDSIDDDDDVAEDEEADPEPAPPVAVSHTHAGGGMIGAAPRPKKGRRLPMPHPLTMTLFAAYAKDPKTDRAHNLVFLDQGDEFSDPELLDLTQVHDKFPMLREFSECTPKSALFLVKFWVDLAFDDIGPEAYFGIDMAFESDESLRIECSTTVILKGRQVVEKIQVEEGRRVAGKTVFELKDSAMCDVMVQFIDKLRTVEKPEMANRILENFSVLQVVRDEKTKDVLSCTAFLFELSRRGLGPRRQVFRMYDPMSEGL